ncbi:RNA polymerase sigma factor [Flavobacterium poyangense]|uniref:RNA polymerase sigma factor n=1 Tax=Flavobacterium poyangense TaxID=2204302 RepID=UPI00142276DD|nr:sigma-70 family RNA polymerase sigma factor [Flavobacterium sp. JXAS1]
MIQNNDIDLIEDFRNGKEKAIRKLYLLYYRPLCYFNKTLIKYSQEAEDISTETFLKLLQKKKDFDTLSDIKAFLFVSSRNACYDFLRKEKRHKKAHEEISFLTESVEQFGEGEMITAKVLQAIYCEMENLPQQCQEVFKSIFIDGKSTAQIAGEMQISPQTVLNQKSKALQKIRLALHQENILSAIALVNMLSVLFYKQR